VGLRAKRVTGFVFFLFLSTVFAFSNPGILSKVKIFTVNASSVQSPAPEKNETYEPRNVKDGAPWTRWSSRFSDEEWLLLDLKKILPVTKVVISWQDAYAKEYSIEVENDSGEWIQVYSTLEGDGGEDVVEWSTVRARKVKINCKKRATEWGYSIWEIEVFGDQTQGL
jgi:hypothetical protein